MNGSLMVNGWLIGIFTSKIWLIDGQFSWLQWWLIDVDRNLMVGASRLVDGRWVNARVAITTGWLLVAPFFLFPGMASPKWTPGGWHRACRGPVVNDVSVRRQSPPAPAAWSTTQLLSILNQAVLIIVSIHTIHQVWSAIRLQQKQPSNHSKTMKSTDAITMNTAILGPHRTRQAKALAEMADDKRMVAEAPVGTDP